MLITTATMPTHNDPKMLHRITVFIGVHIFSQMAFPQEIQ
jgi:hypothetical protein